jgi:uncharacterized membrane protein
VREVVERIALFVTGGVELAAVFVVALGCFDTLARLAYDATHGAAEAGKHAARLRLGRWLALALELELAADIILTAVAPSWSEIGKLAAIATLRTLLNFFLQREIERNANVARAKVTTDDGRVEHPPMHAPV